MPTDDVPIPFSDELPDGPPLAEDPAGAPPSAGTSPATTRELEPRAGTTTADDRSRRRRRTAAVAVPVVAAVVVLSMVAGWSATRGPGDEAAASAPVAPPRTTVDWAGDVCTEVSTWLTDVGAAVAPTAEGGGVTEQLHAMADRAATASERAADHLRAVPPPTTGAIADAQDQLTAFSEHLDAEVTDLRAELDRPTDGPLDTLSRAADLAGTSMKAAGEARSTFEKIASLDTAGEVQHAFSTAPACQDLTGSGALGAAALGGLGGLGGLGDLGTPPADGTDRDAPAEAPSGS